MDRLCDCPKMRTKRVNSAFGVEIKLFCLLTATKEMRYGDFKLLAAVGSAGRCCCLPA